MSKYSPAKRKKSRGFHHTPTQWEFERMVREARCGVYKAEDKFHAVEVMRRLRSRIEDLYAMDGHRLADVLWNLVSNWAGDQGAEQVMYMYDEAYELIKAHSNKKEDGEQ